jgi:CheY-like chemotaxis protein
LVGASAGCECLAVVDRATVALCAEMLGGMQAAFEMTLDYLKTRSSSASLIGTFQALTSAARMFVEIELARSAVMGACDALDRDAPDAGAGIGGQGLLLDAGCGRLRRPSASRRHRHDGRARHGILSKRARATRSRSATRRSTATGSRGRRGFEPMDAPVAPHCEAAPSFDRAVVKEHRLDLMIDATVYVVDDDPALRESLGYLLQSEGLIVRAFEGARQFLAEYDRSTRGCLVVDVRMPEMSGLQLRTSRRRGFHVAGHRHHRHGDVPVR